MKDSNVFRGFGKETVEEIEKRISSVRVDKGGELKVNDFTFGVHKRHIKDRFLVAIYGNYEPEGFMDDLKFTFNSRLVLQEKMKAYFKHNRVDENSSLIVFDVKTGIELEYLELTNTFNNKDIELLSDSIWKTLDTVLKSHGEDLSKFVDNY